MEALKIKLKDWCMLLLTSPELWSVLLILIFNWRFKHYIDKLSPLLHHLPWYTLISIPIILWGVNYRVGATILHLDKKLYAWPGYWMLRNRVYFTLYICIFAAIANIVALCFFKKTTILILLLSIVLATISTLTLLFAAQTAKYIIGKYG